MIRLSKADAKAYGLVKPVNRGPRMKRVSQFPTLCEAQGLPVPEPEYQFDPNRKWRFDWAWPYRKIALEVEGGVWTGGRHTRGSGFLKDMEKYNRAAGLGWLIFRCTPKEMNNGEVFKVLEEVFRPPWKR